VFDVAALRRAHDRASDAYDREHVTPFLRRHHWCFPALSLTATQDESRLRWTVDTEKDLAFVRAVATRLEPRQIEADMEEILQTIRRPPSLSEFNGVRG
jgi:spore coat polysaccharide biosynthesis protein SpsF